MGRVDSREPVAEGFGGQGTRVKSSFYGQVEFGEPVFDFGGAGEGVSLT